MEFVRSAFDVNDRESRAIIVALFSFSPFSLGFFFNRVIELTYGPLVGGD